MTAEQEREMHDLAVRLEELTRGTGWEAGRYMAVGSVLTRLTEYCATCDCQAARNRGEHVTVAPDRVTRLEVVDSELGRVFTSRPVRVSLSYQDLGRTLKVFVTRGGNG